MEAMAKQADALTNAKLGAESRAAGERGRDTSHQEAVANVFREHNEQLVRFLSVRLGSVSEAVDVAQEAYVRILGLDTPDVISHLRAYLFKTASNLAINRIKERHRHGEFTQVDITTLDIKSTESAPEAVFAAREPLNQVQRVVEELPPKCRKAFLLYKFECLGYAEIAGRMNLSESMIRKYVLRAMRHCKDRLI